MNRYQAAIITGIVEEILGLGNPERQSYAVFTYNCDEMRWTGTPNDLGYTATIGYYVDGDMFENHEFSGDVNANEIACVNDGGIFSDPLSNVIYRLDEGWL